jgi:hypothetical protein
MPCSYENGDKCSGSIKYEKFLAQLRNDYVSKEDSAVWSSLISGIPRNTVSDSLLPKTGFL